MTNLEKYWEGINCYLDNYCIRKIDGKVQAGSCYNLVKGCVDCSCCIFENSEDCEEEIKKWLLLDDDASKDEASAAIKNGYLSEDITDLIFILEMLKDSERLKLFENYNIAVILHDHCLSFIRRTLDNLLSKGRIVHIKEINETFILIGYKDGKCYGITFYGNKVCYNLADCLFDEEKIDIDAIMEALND